MLSDRNCRKVNRQPLSIPVAIHVCDAGDNEYTCQGQVVDASKRGMRIKVDRFFRRESIVLLKLRYPFRLRSYDWFSDYYQAYAIVVHMKKFGPEDFEIGVRLLHDKIPANAESLARI